jgi:S1-C subfamily serine protease
MNEHRIGPPPLPTATPADKRRRRLVLPAVLAALALGAVGSGVGYAAVSNRSQQSAATTSQGSTSTQVLQPTTNGWDGSGYADGGYQTDPKGGLGPQLGSDPTAGDSQSTDTTGKASGSQLTGLVRIVSTMGYDGAVAAGTGMVLTSDGEVVTNHHVVEGATTVRVKVMSTGTTYSARVVGTDASDDIAVLQLVGASGLDTVTPDTDGVTTGDAVTAVGDGEGRVSYLSAATGSVLATNQAITTLSEGTATGERLTELMEISSDVVGGYSGGATYDADGQVVGMTTAASSGTSDIVGYAIPIAKVLRIADDLESGTQAAAYSFGYPAFLGIALGNGTAVQGVYDDTPASDAGIDAGDVITKIGGVRVPTTAQLRTEIARHSPGDEVAVTWTDASGSSHSATVTLAKGPVA